MTDIDLKSRIEQAAKVRKEANEPIWRLIDEVRESAGLDGEARQSYLATLYNSLTAQDMRERDVYNAQTYDVGMSYRANIVDLQRTKKLMQKLGKNLFPGGNPKLKDRAFAKSLGVPVPETYAQNAKLSDIELVPNSILKPVGGAASKGVFFVDDELRLRSVKSTKLYDTLAEAQVEISSHRKSISTSRWILEEAITSKSGEPANDFKVFCFYGVAAMSTEIDRFSYPQSRFASYNRDGEQIERGGPYKTFKGTGTPKGLYEMTEKMSLAAPVPFLRFDFHRGSSGLYLGEITPHPGATYAGGQSDEIDKMMGEHFAYAKARLYVDLLEGKSFPEFHVAYGVK